MKTTLLLVLNLPVMILPAACSRRMPAAEGAQSAEISRDSGKQAAGQGEDTAREPTARDGPAKGRLYDEPAGTDSGLEAIRRQVQQMKPRQLLEIARECSQKLTDTEQAIRPLAKRLEAIPMTDRLSHEAQKATAELQTLRRTQSTLSKELDIYTAALKAYGLSLEE